MSLILRKEAQEILNENGLSNYFAGIDGSRRFTLNNECGGETFAVTGVAFSRANPTRTEIEYACELLSDFFRKNGARIKEFVVELDILASMPEPTLKSDGTIYNDKKLESAFWVTNEWKTPTAVNYLDKGLLISVAVNDINRARVKGIAADEVNAGFNSNLKSVKHWKIDATPENIGAWKPTIALRRKADSLATELHEHQQQRDKCREIRKELNSCRVLV